jgi:hypothetical protein
VRASFPSRRREPSHRISPLASRVMRAWRRSEMLRGGRASEDGGDRERRAENDRGG